MVEEKDKQAIGNQLRAGGKCTSKGLNAADGLALGGGGKKGPENIKPKNAQKGR